jgi:hypothetical protein
LSILDNSTGLQNLKAVNLTLLTTLSALASETSTSTLTRWFVTDAGKEGIFYYDSADTTTSHDGVMTVVSGTRRYKRFIPDRAINVLWWGADNTGTNDTSAAQQAMFDWVGVNAESTAKIIFPSGRYKVDSQITLPLSINTITSSTRIFIEGYGATLFTEEDDVTIWDRIPANQSEADVAISDYIATIKGITFEGDSGSNQIGLRLGAMYSWVFEDLTFVNFSTGSVFEFALNCGFRGLRYQTCVEDSFVGTFGSWTGATESNSAFNANVIETTRVYGASGAATHYKALGGNGNYVKNFVSEGASPQYNFYVDWSGATPVKNNFFDNIWIESNGGSISQGVAFRLRNVGLTVVRGIHMDYDDILFDLTDCQGNVIFEQIHYLGALPTPAFIAGSDSPNVDYKLKFTDIDNSDLFKDKLFNPASWQEGVVPISIVYEYTGDSGSGAYRVATTGGIDFYPAAQSASGSSVITHGRLYAVSTASSQLQLHYDDTNYADFNAISGGRIVCNAIGSAPYWTWQVANVIKMELTGNDLDVYTHIYPSPDNTLDLGRNDLHWRKLYVGDIDASGTITNTNLTNALNLKAPLASPQFTDQIGVGTPASSSARISLPTGTTAADGILFGDIAFYRKSPTQFATNSASINLGSGFIYSSNGISNATATANSVINAGNTGAVITRDVNDGNPSLTVNQKQGAGPILKGQFNSVDKFEFQFGGRLSVPDIQAFTGSANGYINLSSGGIVVSRNVADAGSALAVNQVHAASTGKILDLLFNGTSKASVDKDGNVVSVGNYNTVAGSGTFTKTTEQLRLAYDASNYVAFTVGSSGSVTASLTGTSPNWTFGQVVQTTGGIRTATSSGSGNFEVITGNQALGTTAISQNQFTATGAVTILSRILERGSTGGTLSSGNAYIGHIIGAQTITTASSGAHPFVSALAIKAPAVTASGTATVTNAATVLIEGGITGITPTGRNDTLRVDGSTYLNGDISFTGNLIPTVANTYNLGSSGNYIGSIYSNTTFANSLRSFNDLAFRDSSGNELMRMVNSNGNFIIQKGGTITDNGAKLQVTGNATVTSDVEITDTTKGIILKSPDGTRYRVTVANGGTLTTTAI